MLASALTFEIALNDKLPSGEAEADSSELPALWGTLTDSLLSAEHREVNVPSNGRNASWTLTTSPVQSTGRRWLRFEVVVSPQ